MIFDGTKKLNFGIFSLFSKKNHYGENSFRDFRKVLMSSTKKDFQILHVWVIFWDFETFYEDFLERYLAETFRTINEVGVLKFLNFKTCFYFVDNAVVHFENCYAHFFYQQLSHIS